jgi:hypothetical protein
VDTGPPFEVVNTPGGVTCCKIGFALSNEICHRHDPGLVVHSGT